MTSETLPSVNLVPLFGVNDVGLVITLCVTVCTCVCGLDGEKEVFGVGGDPDGPVHIDVCGSHHTHSSVFHERTRGHQ